MAQTCHFLVACICLAAHGSADPEVINFMGKAFAPAMPAARPARPVQQVDKSAAISISLPGRAPLANPATLVQMQQETVQLEKENFAISSELQQLRSQIATAARVQSRKQDASADATGTQLAGVFGIAAVVGAFLYSIIDKFARNHTSGVRSGNVAELQLAGAGGETVRIQTRSDVPMMTASTSAAKIGDKTVARASPVMMGNTNNFKVGMTIEHEKQAWRVLEFLHVKPGKGPAFVRSKLKSLQTGKTLDKTWRAGESFPDAVIDDVTLTFTYIDGDNHVFMNMETFEEERLKTAIIDGADFLKEDTAVNVLYWKGEAIDVQIPQTVTVKVAETAAPYKDNTSDGRREKAAILETGAKIKVPLFIDVGEAVIVDTVDRKYLGRANK